MSAISDRVSALPPERRALLERLLAQRSADRPAIGRSTGPAVPSFAQERMWVLHQLDAGHATYTMKGAVRFPGELDPDALGWAFQRVAERHETLRSRFAPDSTGTPRLLIAPPGPVPIRLEERDGWPAAERLAAEEAARPFDLERGPLLRVLLVRVAGEGHLLALAVHHIVADGWSVGVLVGELARLYAARREGRPDPLPPLPARYRDYAAWQRAELTGSRLSELLDYWVTGLDGAPAVSTLPPDRPRPAVRSSRGAVLPVELGPRAAAALRALARGQGVTPFMVMLAAMAVVLGRQAGQQEVVIGTPVAGRTRPELEPLIGLFVNSLALRVDLRGDPGFGELLARVKSVALGAYDHQDLPFERLVQAVAPPRHPSHSPIFQVQLALDNTPSAASEWQEGAQVRVDNATAKFDLNLMLAPDGDGMRGGVEYAEDLFDQATVARFWQHLCTVVERAAADPARPISALDLLTAAEREEAMAAATGPVTAEPRACLHELVAEQVERAPESIAVVSGQESLTYRELWSRACGVAHHLRAAGVGPDQVVGVRQERGAGLVVSVLGVLLAGGAYLPLDPSYPPERLSLMADDAGAVATLAAADHGSRDAPPAARRGPGHLAYTIFTSGSTGRPKGVQVTHAAIVNRLLGMRDQHQVGPGDVILHKTPIGFDVSVWELLLPLVTGARLVVAPPGAHRDPAWLTRIMAEQGVTMCHFVPSMLRAYLEHERLPATVTRVVCSGEALTSDLAERFRGSSAATLVNLYGPTEAAIDVTAHTVGAADTVSVPIGRPVPGVRAYVLDERMRPAPVNVAGELFIGGRQLARGYAARPAATAERFVADPFGVGGRLYRTGDRARRRADGSLEFLGRDDRQVKVRGHRVEPGEVEAALCRQPGVRAAAVRAWPDTGLVAYVVAPDWPGGPAMRGLLARTLPEFAIPATFVVVESLPLSVNGKVDWSALPEPSPERPAGLVPPSTPAQSALVEVWAEVLGHTEVGVRNNFFTLGGDSIKAIRVVALARDRGLELDVNDLFQHPTIEELAAAARDTSPQDPAAGLLSDADRERFAALRRAVEAHEENEESHASD
ncbi:non-ribosomal peptide synthetase [Nonomuraea pusilla]|uniref:Amino acid adenylation domain-containing protein n=1 Tax=Nonomuraea pusilla TaxID=46177 RepID=A0A1H7I8U6_9ACTN|nr:non-ribosomal peptide synthetase [Nonomuraea pusilla]SEK57930.1 amino acid adenylation domain-containing protein [Nonomuraea pusilla]